MKRIIGMILVVVMLALSLASCGAFDYTETSMTKYSEYKEENKKTVAEWLKELIVEDGDFSADPEMRAKKVLDAIYEVLAGEADTTDKQKTETPNDRDVVYYCYYATVDTDGDGIKESVVFSDKMKESGASKIQLGAEYGDDLLSAAIVEKIQMKFEGKVYSTTTSTATKASEGDVAYVTYTKKVGENGSAVKHTNEKMVIGAPVASGEKATTLESYLAGQKLATSITSLTVGEGESKVVYSDIKINWIFARQTSGTVADGDKVTITLTYVEKAADGKETTKTENKFITVGDGSQLSAYVLGKEINKTNSSTTEKKIIIDGKEYKTVKVDWRVNETPAAFTVDDTTYDEETKVTPVGAEKEVDLNGKELTYYIYPVYYVDTPEFTAENIIKLILLDEDAILETDEESKMTEEQIEEEVEVLRENLYAMLFGEDYANLDEKDADDKKKIEERNEFLKNYKADSLSIDDLAKQIVDSYIAIRDAKVAYSTASKEYSDLYAAYEDKAQETEDAKLAYENAKDDEDVTEEKLAELKEAWDDAVAAENKAKEASDKAEATKNEQSEKEKTKETDRDNLVNKLLGIKNSAEGAEDVTLGEEIIKGYRILVYDSLQDSYNEEMKTKFAKEIYYLITKNITVTGYPEDAVDDVYDQLMNDYSWEFYNEKHSTSTSSATITNYKYYDGDIDLFLIDAAKSLEGGSGVKNVKEAKVVIRHEAERLVEPIIKLYMAAEAYGQTITEDEFETYKEKYLLENSYNDYITYYINNGGVYPSSDEVLYGENYSLLRHAAQLDKLLDWFLECEEKDVEDKSDETLGYEYKIYDYKQEGEDIFEGNYKDGDPLSAEKDEDTSDKE